MAGLRWWFIHRKELCKMRVYVAGKMRGVPYYGFPQFDAMRDKLMAEGHSVVSPADIDRNAGFDAMKCAADTDWNAIPAGFDLQECVERDLLAVLECDAIMMMDGWEKSTGARAEFAVATWAGKTVLYETPKAKPTDNFRPMTKAEYFEFHREFCEKMQKVTATKNADYTGKSDDPFANFAKVEGLGICSTEQGFLVRLTDKICRITSFVQKGVLEVKDESVLDTLHDCANYCALMAGYIESKRRQNKTDEPKK